MTLDYEKVYTLLFVFIPPNLTPTQKKTFLLFSNSLYDVGITSNPNEVIGHAK